ncbi:hypothetical protein Dimus_030805, partial [Dionaea muscipula]
LETLVRHGSFSKAFQEDTDRCFHLEPSSTAACVRHQLRCHLHRSPPLSSIAVDTLVITKKRRHRPLLPSGTTPAATLAGTKDHTPQADHRLGEEEHHRQPLPSSTPTIPAPPPIAADTLITTFSLIIHRTYHHRRDNNHQPVAQPSPGEDHAASLCLHHREGAQPSPRRAATVHRPNKKEGTPLADCRPPSPTTMR